MHARAAIRCSFAVCGRVRALSRQGRNRPRRTGAVPAFCTRWLIGLALLPGLIACSHPAAADPGSSVFPDSTKPTPGVLIARTQPPADQKPPPPTLVLNRLGNLFGSVTFSHEAHVEFASEGCSQCHHKQGEAEPVKVCGNCHDRQLFQPAEKLNRPGLSGAYHRQCIQCHVGMGSGPTGCNDCHKPRDQSPGDQRGDLDLPGRALPGTPDGVLQ